MLELTHMDWNMCQHHAPDLVDTIDFTEVLLVGGAGMMVVIPEKQFLVCAGNAYQI